MIALARGARIADIGQVEAQVEVPLPAQAHAHPSAGDAVVHLLARQRIDAIQPEMFSEETFTFTSKRERPRIPFGALLENGLLQPGQKLYFGKAGNITATILANGAIKHNGTTGSIHQVGKEIQQAPCNGWEHWYYFDEDKGERVVIDRLRQILYEHNKQVKTDSEE